eukprot:TRINITY_DN4087_c1_g1_i1.p1 TRINITY_DN4087_c1_g1~~TRINITY_DN4087_c1_g1_i1.p1  ORF type:complete len:237 (+),score=65.15 TRINITY_DN4087_c1_g1_i1:658-1368(+)
MRHDYPSKVAGLISKTNKKVIRGGRWIIMTHGEVYAKEYGWNAEFEGLVAKIVSDYASAAMSNTRSSNNSNINNNTNNNNDIMTNNNNNDNNDNNQDDDVSYRQRAWIAEYHGKRVGCIMCVPGISNDEKEARLRILLVTPEARGLGAGRRLVDECVKFATNIGCSRVTLWTNDVLVAARRIYQAAGFQLVDEFKHRSFGVDLMGQNWRLDIEQQQHKSSSPLQSSSPSISKPTSS